MPSRNTDKQGLASRLEFWHAAAVLLVLAVVGLGGYGLWPVLTGSTSNGPAEREAEAPASEATIDVVVARRTDLPLRARASGHLRPWHRAVLKAESSGPVVARPVREGEQVEEGEVLVRLRSEEERIALEEARAEMLTARAEYQAKYEGEGLALARADTTAGPGALPDQTRSATQAASSGLTAARQAVRRARLNLRRTRVKAPFSGRVAHLEVETGQSVSTGETVATLLDDDRLKVEVDVLESDVVHLEKGASARVHVPALGPATDSTAQVTGTVWAVNPTVDPQSGTGAVTVAIPNPDGELVSGLYADVWLETRRLEDRLVVPDEAVLVRQGRDLVFVVENGRAQWTYVDVGARSGEHVAITDGVAPGDTVAVDGHFALAHDAPVSVTAVRPLGLGSASE
jgi:HlyD family secretion protein